MRTTSAIAVGAAVAVLAAGCTASPGTGPSGAPTSDVAYADGGTFTMAVAGDPGTLNPLNNTATTANWLFRALYDPLVTRAEDGTIMPGIAESWEFDGTTAVFTLRDDVTCADDSPVTPSVVAKAFEYVKNPDNPSTLIGATLPNRNFTFEADDEAGTFTLTLDAPFSLLLSALSFMHIPCGAGADDPTAITLSSGSGPFVMTEAVPNDHYTLAKREGYAWGVDGASTDAPGTPDEVVYQIVDNETTAANLLFTGEINAAVVNGNDRPRLTAAGLNETAYVSGDVVITFSNRDGRVTQDLDVRKAITMAIDRADVATTVTAGMLPEAGTSISAANPQVCEDSTAAAAIPAYDPDAANELLDEAGWVAGADGIREKEGKRLSVNILFSTATPRADVADELIADFLSEIGVEAVISPKSQADYTQQVFTLGEWDIAFSQFANPFPSTLTGLLAGPFPEATPPGTNAGHIDNPEYKDLIVKARASGEDSGCEYWIQASEALFEQANMIPIADWPTNWVLNGAELDTLGGRPIWTSVKLLAS